MRGAEKDVLGPLAVLRRRSGALLQALVEHRHRVNSLKDEWLHLPVKDTLFHGVSSANIAEAFASKVPNSPKASFVAFENWQSNTSLTGADGISDKTTMAAATGSTSVADGNGSPIFSWATLLQDLRWARTIYGITWIITGLFALFVGYAALFWLHDWSIAVKARHKKSSRQWNYKHLENEGDIAIPTRKSKEMQILKGGVGGFVVGFLFASYLVAVIHNAVVTDNDREALSSKTFFVVWLLSGILGSLAGGYSFWLCKGMCGILGAACTAIILSAMFGVKTLLVRAVVVGVLAFVMTVPLLLPWHPMTRFILLNASTSIAGMVTFLNGVAVLAPSRPATANWLDLWNLLFKKKQATEHDILTGGWSSSEFKGIIAAACLGAAVGFGFEFFFHRSAGQDPESEWNQYLATYTERLEAGQSDLYTTSSRVLSRPPRNDIEKAARAGLFEPTPSPWQRISGLFDRQSRPASYGQFSGDSMSLSGSPAGSRRGSVTSRIRQMRSERYSTASTAISRPARFEEAKEIDKDVETDDVGLNALPSLLRGDPFDSNSEDESSSKNGTDVDSDDDRTAVESQMGRARPIAMPRAVMASMPSTPSPLSNDRLKRMQDD